MKKDTTINVSDSPAKELEALQGELLHIESRFSMLIDKMQALNPGLLQGSIPAGDFAAFAKSLITGRISSWDEIDAYAKQLPEPPERYITMSVAEANPSFRSTSINTFISKLKTIFPKCSAAQVGDFIIIMISAPEKTYQPMPSFDKAQLEGLLNEYDAYISFGNATQRFDMLRTTYLLAESTLRLARSLREQENTRIFCYEDYAEYVYIDLLMDRFRELMGHDDLLFLTSPDAVDIYRYDQQNGTDLQLVLYQYCKHNGNISAAAKASYMHRNTFSARMAQIKKLLRNVDLSDGHVRQRLLSSCRVFRYYNFYYDKKAAKSLTERLAVTIGN